MANFAEQAVTKGWIEGSVNDSKRPGGYCTTFLRSRTSRIYTTYQGTLRDVETVAHELGHAFHNWAMKDMDLLELEYPMTLAETASILAETVLNEHLAVTAKDRAAVFDTAWNDAISAEAFLVSIPARFEIEKELCIRRKNGPLSVAELKALTNEAFKKYYGDSLTEFPTLSWAQTLHFYITGTTFYNFPYTFGYLFSLGVYAQKEKLGKNFYPAYLALLRDTGRMSAEDVAQKHLGVDISKPDFWVEAIKIVENKVNHFENLVTELI
jgi:oligoendopeptidase F